MCYEYRYHSCGVHYYRVERILPNLCRCPQEFKITDEDEPCDDCDPPPPEAPRSISAKNIRHLQPESPRLVDQASSAGSTDQQPWVIDVRGKLKDHDKPGEPTHQEEKKKRVSWVSKARSLFMGPAYPENSSRPNEYPVGIRANMKPDDDDDNNWWDTNPDGQPGPFDEDGDNYNGIGMSAARDRGRWKDFY
ncbi:hypothetical protein Dda_1622 [Drechslerella dactyloides]|uniref:Uncharacterized protein n=1 Tax=Drechslerella dactyloides TaxID=74499 RepID=A0AAD6NN91_DREDA|nr:hypothetical protein Dda_1622 [Drechslerella dactyloides]